MIYNSEREKSKKLTEKIVYIGYSTLVNWSSRQLRRLETRGGEGEEDVLLEAGAGRGLGGGRPGPVLRHPELSNLLDRRHRGANHNSNIPEQNRILLDTFFLKLFLIECFRGRSLQEKIRED